MPREEHKAGKAEVKPGLRSYFSWEVRLAT